MTTLLMSSRHTADNQALWRAAIGRGWSVERASGMRLPEPVFVKPPNDKSFAAQVYQSGAGLPVDYDDEMTVLVAEPVQWDAEFRCFCLDGKVRTLSPYLRSGVLASQRDYDATNDELRAATDFAENVIASANAVTPRAVVLDVGQIVGRGWSVVEANAAWGSGIYGCDPSAALDVIRQATLQAGN